MSVGGRAGATTGRQSPPSSGWRNERRVANTRPSRLGRNTVRIPTVSEPVDGSRCTRTNCCAVWGENLWPAAGTISRSTDASSARPPSPSRRRSSSTGLRLPRADQRASRIDVLPELFSPTRYVVPGARSSRTSWTQRKPRTTTRETRMPAAGSASATVFASVIGSSSHSGRYRSRRPAPSDAWDQAKPHPASVSLPLM